MQHKRKGVDSCAFSRDGQARGLDVMSTVTGGAVRSGLAKPKKLFSEWSTIARLVAITRAARRKP
jgi:hypothetical protein